MGTSSGNQKSTKTTAKFAVELFPDGIPSEASQKGRRLVLKFKGAQQPQLDRIEFHASRSSEPEHLQRGLTTDKTRSFKADKVTKALPIFFLDYLCARLHKPPKSFLLEGGNGSLASTLGYAIAKNNGKWFKLFTEYLPNNQQVNRVSSIFEGTNFEGHGDEQRVISVCSDYLPPDCIEVFWNEEPLDKPEKIRKLTGQFRLAWKLPPPCELDLRVGEEIEPPKPAPAKAPEPLPQPSAKKEPTDSKEKDAPPKIDWVFGKQAFEFKQPAPEPETNITSEPAPAPAKIDPRLFEIQNPDQLEWNDSDGLINFGHAESNADVWTIRDASEGLLILGAVGSGKTSSSGSAVATALLKAGYGGLILTAKTDETKRWLRLCQRTGRAEDCIHVTPESGHRLNMLQYETQRPGNRIAIATDLVALFRCIIGVMMRSKSKEVRDDFWTLATDELMKTLFEIFLLAEEPLTFSSLVRFVQRAPTNLDIPWQRVEYFGGIVECAKKNAKKGSEADQIAFQEAFDYWTKTFPEMWDGQRSGIITGFTAMAKVFNDRGLRELVSTGTTLTPEAILSGKIVILDFPLKANSRGGLMAQALWKLLFQQAIERRADKGLSTARPCFLWEDEGHLFFSQYDVDFQPTSRDCRAAHVILSQNIHNFLHLGHDEHAVYAVFAAMNTYIFHTNGDHQTNSWASERIGNVRTKHFNTSGLVKGFANEDFSLFPRQPQEAKSVGDLGIGEKNEPAVPPEYFGKLKKGGHGSCNAIIYWLAHEFAANKKRNYCERTFTQEEREKQ